jgi:hypothetical protein
MANQFVGISVKAGVFLSLNRWVELASDAIGYLFGANVP